MKLKEIMNKRFSEALVFAKQEGTDKCLENAVFITNIALSDLENISPYNVKMEETNTGFVLKWSAVKWSKNIAELISLSASFNHEDEMYDAQIYFEFDYVPHSV